MIPHNIYYFRLPLLLPQCFYIFRFYFSENHISDYIQKHRNLLLPTTPSTNKLIQLMYHILTHSYFSFNDKFYHQMSGTAMGCRMAPPYANIFIHYIDQKILTTLSTSSYITNITDDFWMTYSSFTTATNTHYNNYNLISTLYTKPLSSSYYLLPPTLTFLT